MANQTAVEARARDSDFVDHCGLWGLQDRLPLGWSTPPGVSPSPKQRYRSHYLYQGWKDLLVLTAWTHLSDFDLVLRLVDISGLRPILAQRLGWTSARGWCPFDPVSMFLLQAWQIVNCWSRAETNREGQRQWCRSRGSRSNLVQRPSHPPRNPQGCPWSSVIMGAMRIPLVPWPQGCYNPTTRIGRVDGLLPALLRARGRMDRAAHCG